MFDVIHFIIPGLSVVAEAALRQLAVAHGLHVEERPHAGQRLAFGPVGARADVGQAPAEGGGGVRNGLLLSSSWSQKKAKRVLLLDNLLKVVECERPLERLLPPVASARGGRLAVADRVQRELLLQLVQTLKCVKFSFEA